MRLADLNPDFTRGEGGKGYLSFDCPCGCGDRIAGLPTFDGAPRNTGLPRWRLTGSPPEWGTISLTPSVNFKAGHWHGFITNGEVQP